MTSDSRAAIRRVIAFSLDWFVIAVWGAVLFAGIMIATGGRPARPETPWQAQLIGFLSMTLPVTLYFSLSESSNARATLGKRIVGLAVSNDDEGRLSLSASLLRNAVKFIPWELGHFVAQQAIASGDAGVPMGVWVAATLSFGLVGWWMAALFLTGRTPYDQLAHARVRMLREDPVS
jgi:uncharacterized RDD family membrane protein YckC